MKLHFLLFLAGCIMHTVLSASISTHKKLNQVKQDMDDLEKKINELPHGEEVEANKDMEIINKENEKFTENLAKKDEEKVKEEDELLKNIEKDGGNVKEEDELEKIIGEDEKKIREDEVDKKVVEEDGKQLKEDVEEEERAFEMGGRPYPPGTFCPIYGECMH